MIFFDVIIYHQNNVMKYADTTGKVVRKWEPKSDLTDVKKCEPIAAPITKKIPVLWSAYSATLFMLT